MSYTKGEWKVKDNKYALATYIVTKENDNIAMLSWTILGHDVEEREANASLIAAAPELLEACKTMLRWHSVDKWRNSKNKEEMQAWDKTNCLLTQAISKAEGK